MRYDSDGNYRLEYKIPKYTKKVNNIENDKYFSVDAVSISIPFGIKFNVTPTKNEVKTAKETILTLIDRRILNSKECCANCIKKSVESLKEIKSDLIQIKIGLVDCMNSSLYYFIDYIIISINSFTDFIERNHINEEEHKIIYFDGLEKIRKHIALCMIEISKIGKISIDRKIFAFQQQDNLWIKENYL